MRKERKVIHEEAHEEENEAEGNIESLSVDTHTKVYYGELSEESKNNTP